MGHFAGSPIRQQKASYDQGFGLAWGLASGLLLVQVLSSPSCAQTVLPNHPTVAQGNVGFSQNAKNLTITQSSNRAVVNWADFSIGAGSTVQFIQPGAGSAILNRVTGLQASQIAGLLTSNGQVFLVNPNGIVIKPDGAIVAGGGFVGTTLAIADSAFASGNLAFQGNGASASVTNAGHIQVGRAGFVGLLGGAVDNSGTISAPLGKVGLGSGELATLDLNGDGFLQVALPTSATTAQGQALVTTTGKVRAAGGLVEIKAATAADAVREAINVSGVVSARSGRRSGGTIVLSAGDGGGVSVHGKLDASGKKHGGNIHISGRHINLSGARILAQSKTGPGGSISVSGASDIAFVSGLVDASGGSGGGQVSIVAGQAGTNANLFAGSDSIVRADATSGGDGGQIVLRALGETKFEGFVSAQALGLRGNGGTAEVSGAVLDYAGRVNLLAVNGQAGTLVLDPYDIVISSSGDVASSGFVATGSGSTINTATLESALAGANVTVTTGMGGGETGNITLASNLAWNANTKLTLEAAGAILVNASISNSASGSGLALNASGSGGVSGSGNIANAGVFSIQLAAGAAGVLSGTISGPGSFTLDGPGTLTLTGTNTYTGGTTVRGGATLSFAPQAGINVLSSRTVEIDGASTYQVAAPNGRVDFSNFTFNFDSTGGGTLDLAGTGANGGPNLQSGSLTINTNGGATDYVKSSSGVAFNNGVPGANLNLNTVSDLVISNALSNAGNVNKTGSGLATLSGDLIFSGTLSVLAGRLDLSGSWTPPGTASVSVANGAVFSGAGTINANSFAASGAGTFNLTGNNQVSNLTTSNFLTRFTFNNDTSLSVGSISASGPIAITTTSGSLSALNLPSGSTLTSQASGDAITLSADGSWSAPTEVVHRMG